MKKYVHGFVLAVLIGIIIAGCRQDVPKGLLPHGSVALTFDDASVDNWYDHLPLLDSLGIKATFYISKYHTLSPEQKQRLHLIAAHGHEIAYHTTNHSDLRKLLEKKGMDYVIREEILKDLDLMQQDGFNITNFAYPYGSHVVELDNELLRYFNSLRALANKTNYGKALALQSCKKQLFYGPDIDDNDGSWPDDGMLKRMMEMADDKNACLVLTAHQINNPRYKLSLTRGRLLMLAEQARQHNLDFITIRELSD